MKFYIYLTEIESNQREKPTVFPIDAESSHTAVV